MSNLGFRTFLSACPIFNVLSDSFLYQMCRIKSSRAASHLLFSFSTLFSPKGWNDCNSSLCRSLKPVLKINIISFCSLHRIGTVIA